jgi:hypothetical protein
MLRKILRGGAVFEPSKAPQFRREGVTIIGAKARVSADGSAQVWL